MEIAGNQTPLEKLQRLTGKTTLQTVEPCEADPRLIAVAAAAKESVQYHASDDYVLSSNNVAGNEIQIYQMLETMEERSQREYDVFRLLNSGLADVSADLKRAFDDAVFLIPKDLAQKDWGFSVTENGKIVVIERHDALTANEKMALQSQLSEPYLESAATNFANLVIRALELDRGPDKATSGIGKYDLTQANFQDIIDLRAFLDAPITGQYAKRYETLIDKNDFWGLYWGMRGAISSQLEARGEPKYMRKAK